MLADPPPGPRVNISVHERKGSLPHRAHLRHEVSRRLAADSTKSLTETPGLASGPRLWSSLATPVCRHLLAWFFSSACSRVRASTSQVRLSEARGP
jgi:hypothetical protein